MLLRLFPILLLSIVFSGCASTQLKSQNEQLGTRVTELEKDQQSKDAEIVDLQYQVKDLTSKVDNVQPSEPNQTAPESSESAQAAEPSSGAPDNVEIVRVKAAPEKIQRALQAAGVYTGPIDGKIGPGTKEAIIEFQKSHNLKADGVLGRHTWDVLKKYLK